MRKDLLKVMVIIVTAAVMIGGPASAALFDGKVVNYQYFYPDGATPYTNNAANGNYTVGAGIEVPNFVDNRGTIDISDTSIHIAFKNQAYFNNLHKFNGFRIQDANNLIDDFSSVVASTNLSELYSSMIKITFDADNIWVNWGGIHFSGDTYISLDITGSPSANREGVPVPEPASLLLLGIGLVGLTGYARKGFK